MHIKPSPQSIKARCSQTFESIFDFKQHFLKLHLDRNMKVYKCNSCDRICTDNWKLKKHLESHEKGREIQETSSIVPLKVESIDLNGEAIEIKPEINHTLKSNFNPENMAEEVKFEFKSESVSDDV